MSLGLASEPVPISAEKQTVLRQVRCQFEPDGSIRFEATISDRYSIECVQAVDRNLKTVSAVYSDEAAMIALATENWSPSEGQLDAMAFAMSSPEGAVQVILQGFIGISQKAVDVLLNPPAPEI